MYKFSEKMEQKKKFNYKPQFGIVVICSGEQEQKENYEKLEKMGLKLKVVVV